MRYTVLDSLWGSFGFVSAGERLVSAFLPRSLRSLRRLISEQWPAAIDDPDALPSFQRQIKKYFAGKPTRFDVPIDLSGVPPFRAAVLEACRKIPYGRIASYADLARAAGNPAATRAAGSAMAHNPIPLVIPCHRVLRSDGSLGGFSSPSGIAQKKRLLELEGVHLGAALTSEDRLRKKHGLRRAG